MIISRRFDLILMLVNEAMPGYVKIMLSDNEQLWKEINGLYNGSIPKPFTCFYACKVYDGRTSLDAINRRFSADRVNLTAGFFRTEPFYMKPSLQLLALEDMTKEVNMVLKKILEVCMPFVETDSKRAGNRAKRKKRPVLNFLHLNIPVGAELVFTKSADICVHVFNSRKVIYGNRIMSLTSITRELLHYTGAFHGALYWSYAGKKLVDIYNEIYPE